MSNFVKSPLSKGLIGAACVAFFGAANAGPVVWDGSLPAAGNPLTSQQYQDFTIYSLNYLSNLSAQNSTVGSKYYGLLPSPTYNVPSDPGSLHDKVVLVTGNTGTAALNTDTCGATGCDNAYNYPDSSAIAFSTITSPEPNPAVPGEPSASMWTAQASALRNYLQGNDLVFMFNLNESNGGDVNTLAGQSLLVSMKVDLTDANGNPLYSFYVGANNALGLPTTAKAAWAGSGAPSIVPDDYNATLVNSNGPAGWYSTDPRWAYVHGAISVDATTGAFLGMGDCASTKFANCKTVNQNLGANEVAFSAFNQQLSDLIGNPNSGVAFMNVTALTGGQSNGFEQLFIMAADIPSRVPEPASLALMGLGLLGLGFTRRRKS